MACNLKKVQSDVNCPIDLDCLIQPPIQLKESAWVSEGQLGLLFTDVLL